MITIDEFKLNVWFRNSLDNSLIEEITQLIESEIESERLLELYSRAKDFVKENNIYLGITYDFLITVRINKNSNKKIEYSILPSLYGNGKEISKFNLENTIKGVVFLKESIVYLPVPKWVGSSCDCGYSNPNGSWFYFSDAKKMASEFIGQLNEIVN
jgi:hypothetical protein